MQEEVERAEVGELEALHLPLHHIAEVLLDPLGRQGLREELVVLGFVGDHADVGRVTLVSGTGVSKVDELDASHQDPLPLTPGAGLPSRRAVRLPSIRVTSLIRRRPPRSGEAPRRCGRSGRASTP